MTTPLVSVVLVTCNADRYLAESIESILQQSLGEFEFIIVDFGSTDQSRTVAGAYAARDRRIRLGQIPCCVLPEARNTACSLAQGRYLAIMDADDISLPDRLQDEVSFMDRNSEVGLVGGASEWINSSGKRLFVTFEPTSYKEIEETLPVRCPFRHSTVLMRKEVFAAAGGYRRVFHLAEDYDFFLRVAERIECANLTEVVLKYRIHSQQASIAHQRQLTSCKLAAQASASARRRGKPDPVESAREIGPELLTALGVNEASLRRELASDCRDWVHNMFLAGEYNAGLKAAVEFLESDSATLDPSQVAELRLAVARLYWAQERYAKSLLERCRALVEQPSLSGRVLRSMLRRLRPV